MAGYIPSTPAERERMLGELGLNSYREMYQAIPDELLFKGELDLPAGKSELEVKREMSELASHNHVYRTIFRGAGAYRHYIPSIVKRVTNRDEFLTAYTPYQAEISQGVLQSIFEYQTMVCELTGMDVSNASVYDGASAAAEAAHMCCERKRMRALVSATVNPEYAQTVRTYAWAGNRPVDMVPAREGVTDLEALKAELGADVGCVIVQQPNYFGQIEDVEEIVELAHAAGAKVIVAVHPIMTALIKTPGECGADICVAEGQPLGMELSFGGPYLGIMACRSELMRKLPGRIVGQTVDSEGKRAFVLTLQAREQHIRREKASSSICSNQALCAMTASVYMAAMGPAGMTEAARQCWSKAHYAAEKICAIPGFERRYAGEFGMEFVTRCPIDADELNARLKQHDILGGLNVNGDLLWCFTEMNTRAEIDALAELLKEVRA